MNKMTRFGIVISTYRREDGNSPQFVERALNSIKQQTYQNYKVFLIGDKYEDSDEFQSFAKIIDSKQIYAENLPVAMERDTYKDVLNLWCSGGLYAFNHGTELAIKDGIDYIIRLDHDDWFEPTHLENFNECINETGADFMFSKSTYLGKPEFPEISDNRKFIPQLPIPEGMVNSSHCMNCKTISLRSRNVFKETGRNYPSDADLWNRLRNYIPKNKLKSYLINEVTCNHETEGYARTLKL